METEGGDGWNAAFREALEASGVQRLLSPQAAAALNCALIARGARATPRVLSSARVTCQDCGEELASSTLSVKRHPRADCIIFDLPSPLLLIHVPRWCRRCQQVLV